jgi:hypothetical protein
LSAEVFSMGCWAPGGGAEVAAILGCPPGDASAVQGGKDRAEWIASALLALTAATRAVLVRGDRPVFDSDGEAAASSASSAAGEAKAAAAFRAATKTLELSAAGRVALPDAHPTFAFLREAGAASAKKGGSREGAVRTVVLQRVDDRTCWVVASPDPLAALPPPDLALLGRLASYLRSP